MKDKNLNWDNVIIGAAACALTGLFFEASGFQYIINYFTMLGFIMSFISLGLISKKLSDLVRRKRNK